MADASLSRSCRLEQAACAIGDCALIACLREIENHTHPVPDRPLQRLACSGSKLDLAGFRKPHEVAARQSEFRRQQTIGAHADRQRHREGDLKLDADLKRLGDDAPGHAAVGELFDPIRVSAKPVDIERELADPVRVVVLKRVERFGRNVTVSWQSAQR